MNYQHRADLSFESVLPAFRHLAPLVAIGFVFLALFPVHVVAQGPCCSITAIDQHTGIVTAKVNATAQVFEFKPTNPALLQTLKVGEAIYANFTTRQVSLDGKSPCGTIVATGSAPQSQTPTMKGPGAPQLSAPAQPAPTIRASLPACCGITSIDASKNLASGKENSTGHTFQFKANNPAAMGSLKVGEAIYANFRNMQVSVDGKNVFGTIVSLGQSGIPAGLNQLGKNLRLQPPPQAVLGPPQMVKSLPANWNKPHAQTRLADTGGYNLVHLHGLIGIKSDTALPQGVKDILFLHAGHLPLNQIDNYIVNMQLAQKWAQAHPEPDFLKKAAADANSQTGCPDNRCPTISTDCATAFLDYSSCQIGKKTQDLINWFQNEWKQVTGQLSQDFGQATSCWEEQTLNPLNGQVQFSYPLQFPLSFQRTGNTANPFGKFSGSISGDATFGLPIDANFVAQLQMFYVPCLTIDGMPLFVRPKSLGADGTLGVSETLNANLKTQGQFDQTLAVPPGGGVKIPIEVFPITIDGVPIAEMDVSLYLEGSVNANGNGSLDGTVNLQAHDETAFNFNCGGHGCNGGAHRVPVPDTATESVQVQGRIQLKPAIYAALQLDLDVDVLSGRVGPEPYLFGEIYGCAAASGSQSATGSPTSQEFHALTADVDWGLDLLAEALAGGEQFWKQNWRITGGHLLFKPLAPSNALIPAIAGTTQPPLGKPAVYNVKMPTCYPYSDQMEYQFVWTGRATAGSSSVLSLDPVGFPLGKFGQGSCSISQPGKADCLSNPLQNLPFILTWPAAGNYNLTVTPIRDKHGRDFGSSDTSQVNVSVHEP